MLKFCDHKWVKLEKQPHEIRYIADFKVGIFKCMCTKCGKIVNRKYW